MQDIYQLMDIQKASSLRSKIELLSVGSPMSVQEQQLFCQMIRQNPNMDVEEIKMKISKHKKYISDPGTKPQRQKIPKMKQTDPTFDKNYDPKLNDKCTCKLRAQSKCLRYNCSCFKNLQHQCKKQQCCDQCHMLSKIQNKRPNFGLIKKRSSTKSNGTDNGIKLIKSDSRQIEVQSTSEELKIVQGYIKENVQVDETEQKTKKKIQFRTGRCECRKTKCNNLHCVCFSAGNRCDQSCNCQNCINCEQSQKQQKKQSIFKQINTYLQNMNPSSIGSMLFKTFSGFDISQKSK